MTDEIDWSLTTWEGHRRRQHREYLALSFREKIENLEQLAEVAAAFGRGKTEASFVSDPTATDAAVVQDRNSASTTSGRSPMDIRHEPENHRFVTGTDHGEAVLAYSEIDGETLDYRSTLVPPEDRGQGIGEELVLFALTWARENDRHVIPSCPFVKRVLEDHPEHQPTIATGA